MSEELYEQEQDRQRRMEMSTETRKDEARALELQRAARCMREREDAWNREQETLKKDGERSIPQPTPPPPTPAPPIPPPPGGTSPPTFISLWPAPQAPLPPQSAPPRPPPASTTDRSKESEQQEGLEQAQAEQGAQTAQRKQQEGSDSAKQRESPPVQSQTAAGVVGCGLPTQDGQVAVARAPVLGGDHNTESEQQEGLEQVHAKQGAQEQEEPKEVDEVHTAQMKQQEGSSRPDEREPPPVAVGCGLPRGDGQVAVATPGAVARPPLLAEDHNNGSEQAKGLEQVQPKEREVDAKKGVVVAEPLPAGRRGLLSESIGLGLRPVESPSQTAGRRNNGSQKELNDSANQLMQIHRSGDRPPPLPCTTCQGAGAMWKCHLCNRNVHQGQCSSVLEGSSELQCTMCMRCTDTNSPTVVGGGDVECVECHRRMYAYLNKICTECNGY